jgi:hypothetical protein
VSGTKRTPIARAATQQISPRALALFERTEVARGQGCAATCVANEYGVCRMEGCPPCEDWGNAHSELHAELHLKPWFWPCLPLCPFPPGSAKFQGWRPSKAEWDLWQTLEKARRVAAGEPADLDTQPAK